MFSAEKKWWFVQKSLQLKDVFSLKRSAVPRGSCNWSALRAWLPFPSWAGVPVADSFLHLQGWHRTTKIPYGSLKRTRGIKTPCRIASRRHSRAILNKNTFDFCISTKSNWKMLIILAFPGCLLNYAGEPQRQTGHPQSCKVIHIKVRFTQKQK